MLLSIQADSSMACARQSTEPCKKSADLVGEANLERMPAVVDVLETFSGFDLGVNEPSSHAEITALRVRIEADVSVLISH